jgi:hypothetical protein
LLPPQGKADSSSALTCIVGMTKVCDRRLNHLMRTLAVALVFLLITASLPAQQSKKTLAAGTIANNVYRNPDLGFTYKIILGWVDRTDQNRPDTDSSSNGQVLLAVFEHPPEVKSEGINSAVVIAAEPLSSFAQVKTAADYFEPLTEATTSQGFKAVNEPYETTVGSKSLVRGDFSRESGKTTMYQSSLVMLSKGYAVSFTFIGGSEDEVDQLIGRLIFAPAPTKR